MNNQIDKLIADICDADKRNTDPLTKQASQVILIHNVNDWYNSVIITQQERGQS